MKADGIVREIYHAAVGIPEPFSSLCRHRLGIEGNWLASLREVAHQQGCTCGLEGCLTSLFGGYGSGGAIARAEYLLGKAETRS
jgi:hypothetical protein